MRMISKILLGTAAAASIATAGIAYAAPGMDVQALSREVERLMEQRDRAKAARLSNSFTDWN